MQYYVDIMRSCCFFFSMSYWMCCCFFIIKSCPTLCDTIDGSMPGSPVLTVSRNFLKLMSIKLVMPLSHVILCLSLLLLPSFFHRIKVFSNELTLCIRWPKYWWFNFSISPSNEYAGLISFRIDWLDLFAVQVSLESLSQHHILKALILWHSAFFIRSYFLFSIVKTVKEILLIKFLSP